MSLDLFPCDSSLVFACDDDGDSDVDTSVSRSRSPLSRPQSPVSRYRSRSPRSPVSRYRSGSRSRVSRCRSGSRSPIDGCPESPVSSVRRSLIPEARYPLRSPGSPICIEGTKIDILSLLCTSSRDFLVDKNANKIRVSSLLNSGKYIIILCFELPVESYSVYGLLCWALKAALSTPLWSNNCQLVVALKMRSGWQHKYKYKYKDDFLYSFLSGLPSSLGIPLWDSASYNRLSRFLKPLSDDTPALVLDPNHIVITQSCNSVIDFGALSFPFTDDRITTLLNTVQDWLVERPAPLEDLLGLCLDDPLSNLDATSTTTVSDLKGKLVGLYLMDCGTLVNKINTVYKQCQAKHRDLEIVVVYLCFNDNPLHFMASANAFLLNLGISSWWVLPFHDSTSRMLWNLCHNTSQEKLVIVGPQGHFLEINSVDVIDKCNPIDDMYPYATEPIAKQETSRLQNLTLESLLFSTTKREHYGCLLTLEGDHIPVKELRGKRVLLFIANLYEIECQRKVFDEIMDQMTDWCNSNKEYYHNKCSCSDDDEIILIFVPVSFSKKDLPLFSKDIMSLLRNSTMPWLICPPGDPVREARIVKDITLYGFKGSGFDFTEAVSCLSFQEDGRIVSVEWPKLLSDHDWDDDDDQLYEQLLSTYEDKLDLDFY